jgi:hypothetical protein
MQSAGAEVRTKADKLIEQENKSQPEGQKVPINTETENRKLHELMLQSKAAIQKPEIPVESAPGYDYRAHPRGDAIQHIARDIAVTGLGGGLSGAAATKLAYTILHHDISKNELKRAALVGGLSGFMLEQFGDLYDTIVHNYS